MSSLPLDLRLALRGLLRSPAFAGAVVLTLSLGIGVVSGMFTVVAALLLRPLPFEDPDRLVHIWATNTRDGWDRVEVSPLDYRDWHQELRTFSGFGAFRLEQLHAGPSGATERVQAAYVTAGLFELLGSAPPLGRTLTAEEAVRQEPVALISADWWRTRLNRDPSALGTRIFVNGTPHTIIGVMDERFVFPIPTTHLWLPLVVPPEQETRRTGLLRVVGRLKPGVTMPQARQELEGAAARQAAAYPETNAARGARLVPLREGLMFGYDRVAALSGVLLGACVLVLLLVYANAANLMAARLLAAERPIAIRAALGATRGVRVRPVVLEAVLLVTGGGIGGLLLGGWVSHTLGAAVPDNIYRLGGFGVGVEMVLVTIALCACTVLVVAVWPAIRAGLGAATDPLRDTPSMSASRTARRRFDVLATVQIALATLLLAGALLMGRTLQSLGNVDPGFQPDSVLTLEFSLPSPPYDDRPRIAQFVRGVLDGAAGAPGIAEAAAVNFLPFNHEHRWQPFAVAGADQPGAPAGRAIELVVTDGYFGTMGVPIVAGRAFERADDERNAPVAIVNEAFVRQRLGGLHPIGARVYVPTQTGAPVERIVVGVAADTRQVDLSGPLPPLVYVPFFQEPWSYFRVIARTHGDPRETVRVLNAIVAAADPHVAAWRVRTLRDVMAASVLPQRLIAGTLAALAFGALLLVLVGVYGVVAYAVSVRAHEFAIRMALGADGTRVRRLVLRRAVLLTTIGVGLGLVAALAAGRALQQFLHGVRADDPAVLVGVAAVVAGVTLLASYLPARRASLVNPSDTLRAQ